MNFFKNIEITPSKSLYKGWNRISRYKTLKPLYWITNVYGMEDYIEVPAGYVFDGASIPRILWSIVGNPFETYIIGAALVHDYLYEIDTRRGKEFADLVFLEIMIAKKVNFFKRNLYYYRVKWFGKGEFNKLDKTPIY